MSKRIIVHHSNCPDGFGSAWLLSKSFKPDKIIAANYGDWLTDDFVGADIFILDFCYEPEQLEALTHIANTVVVLDHHFTAAGWLAESPLQVFDSMEEFLAAEPMNVSKNIAIMDQTHSGVGLVQQWCDDRHLFLDFVEKRDLWQRDDPAVDHVYFAVTARPQTIEAWDEIAATPLNDLLTEGRAIERYRNEMIDAAVAGAWTIQFPGFGEIPITSCPYSIGSDVGGALAEQHESKVGAYVVLKKTTARLGLRSRQGGPNVADIASTVGGGGHPEAAGLEVPIAEYLGWL